MSTELEKAKEVLFGESGLKVSDIKLYPGTNRDVTSEQIAKELARSLARISADKNNIKQTADIPVCGAGRGMSYAKLYEWAQTQETSIKRTAIRDKVAELVGYPIGFCQDELDVNILRGYWLKGSQIDDSKFRSFSKDNGAVVVWARDNLNRCWSRLVVVKELMHAFDEAESNTSNPQDFENLIEYFSAGVVNPSNPQAQIIAENSALLRALGILCPQKDISSLRDLRNAGSISDYDVALAFRMPEQFVPIVLEPSFAETIRNNVMES